MDRIQCQVIMNTAINFLIPQNAVNFFSSSATNSLSRGLCFWELVEHEVLQFYLVDGAIS
jgi:hypothetical protein